MCPRAHHEHTPATGTCIGRLLGLIRRIASRCALPTKRHLSDQVARDCRGQPGHDRGAASESGDIASKASDHTSHKPSRKDPSGVEALGRQAVAPTDELHDRRLGDALVVTARDEIAQPRSTPRHPMSHGNGRIVEPDTLRPALVGPDAEVGLLGARACPGLAKAGPKATELEERLTPHEHVRGDQVADRRRLGWQPGIGAAQGPVELLGHPTRAALLPDRLDRSADSDDSRILECGRCSLDPLRRRHGIVVEERDDRATGKTYGAVARLPRSTSTAVFLGDHIGQRLAHTRQEPPDCCRSRR